MRTVGKSDPEVDDGVMMIWLVSRISKSVAHDDDDVMSMARMREGVGTVNISVDHKNAAAGRIGIISMLLGVEWLLGPKFIGGV